MGTWPCVGAGRRRGGGLEVVREGDALRARMRGELLAPFGDQLVVVGTAPVWGVVVFIGGRSVKSACDFRQPRPGGRVAAGLGDNRCLRRLQRAHRSSDLALHAPSVAPDHRPQLRFALVGCGRIAPTTSRRCASMPRDVELVAVCDNRPAALQAAAAQRTGAPGFASLDALLAGSDADCVVLATPSGLHPRQAMRAAAAGRHVMTEKPMATSGTRACTMVRACREAGVSSSSSSRTASTATLQLLQARRVDNGRFGRIHMVNVNVFWTRPQSYYDERRLARPLGPRRRRLHEPGQPLRRHARLAGRPGGQRACLHRHAGARHRGRGHRRGRLRLRNGGLALDQRDDADARPKNFEGCITILGEKRHGARRRRGGEPDPALGVRRPRRRRTRSSTTPATQTTSVYGPGHPLYYDNVIATPARRAAAPRSTATRACVAGGADRDLPLARDGVRVGLPLVF